MIYLTLISSFIMLVSVSFILSMPDLESEVRKVFMLCMIQSVSAFTGVLLLKVILIVVSVIFMLTLDKTISLQVIDTDGKTTEVALLGAEYRVNKVAGKYESFKSRYFVKVNGFKLSNPFSEVKLNCPSSRNIEFLENNHNYAWLLDTRFKDGTVDLATAYIVDVEEREDKNKTLHLAGSVFIFEYSIPFLLANDFFTDDEAKRIHDECKDTPWYKQMLDIQNLKESISLMGADDSVQYTILSNGTALDIAHSKEDDSIIYDMTGVERVTRSVYKDISKNTVFGRVILRGEHKMTNADLATILVNKETVVDRQ